jgi:hypothetical protein
MLLNTYVYRDRRIEYKLDFADKQTSRKIVDSQIFVWSLVTS